MTNCSVFLSHVLPPPRHVSSFLLSLFLPFFPSLCLHLSHPPLYLFQPSLPTLMQIWAWTDGREQKVFTCTQLRTKWADACGAAAPLQSPWYWNGPDRRRRRVLVSPRTYALYYSLTVTTEIYFIWFLSPFHLSLFVFFPSQSLSGVKCFKPSGDSGSQAH